MRYVVTTLVVVFALHIVSQRATGQDEQYIETSPLSTTDTYLTSGDTTVTLGVNVQDTSVFNRRRRAAIEFGMNWGSSAASTTATSMFGLSLIDDYPRNMVGGLAHFEDRPVRIIAALTGTYQSTPTNENFGDIHSFYSNGIATQVDPEVTLAGGQPPTSYTDSTGAAHGFRFRDATVRVQPSYVSLASVATPATNMTLVLRGNSNSGVMYGTPTQRGAWGDWRNNREQNGNRIYVTVRLRRRDTIPDTLADDAVVLRLQLYDRDHDNMPTDSLARVPLLFATVPELIDSTDHVRTYPDAAGASWNTIRGRYWAEMTARDTVSEKEVGRILLGKSLGTVSDTAFLRRVFDITAGMLRALPVASDGTSEWVEFSASVEFKRTITNTKNKFDEYERTTEFINDNSNLPRIEVKTDNPGFDEKRLVDDPEHPKVLINTNELSLEVYYAQNAAVDIDWIRFETPHARRILRDEYRYEIARGVKKFVDFFKTSIASKNSDHRILGIRLMEELDEEGWLVQRYMHRLLNGYAVTEQHGHPNNRWRHVVGASDLGSATALPTWHWNGSSNFHPRAETPAPYVHVGHGGNWFDEALAAQWLVTNRGYEVGQAEAEVKGWNALGIQASLDLKFGMRRAFIDKDIILPEQPGGKPQYRSPSGNLTDLEVGDAGAPFPTWWNDLSAYELEYGGQYKRKVNGELIDVIKNDSETFTYLLTQPLPYADLVGSDVFTANSDMPLQMGIDKARYQYVYRSDNNAHLFKSRPWLEQIWCYNRYKGAFSSADSNQSMLQHDALRPHTAEELRLSLASAMIFGAKGYMFFAGSAGHDYTEDNEELYERGMWNHNHEGGGPCSNLISTTCALSTCPTTASLDSLIWGNDTTTSSHFGDDFPIGYAASQDPNSALIPRFFKKLDGQRRGFIISHWRMHGAEVFKTDPNNQWMLYNNVNASGLEPTEVYVGFKSPRREILRHVEKITSKAPAPLEQTSGASNDVTWSELLSELSLRAWHGKGYGLMTVTDPNSPENYLNSFIETSSITTRWPYREKPGAPTQDSATYTGTPDHEPSDSSFYDVTILSKLAVVDSTFYVGVVNRRTNPVVVENADDPTTRRYRFVTPFDMETDTLLRKRPYQQVGAREITLPFRYSHPDGRKRLLHVTEVGHPDSARTLDTIIAEDQRLALNYLPGEGRLFRVVAFTPSTNTDARGYLAFNTQTKLIAAPVYGIVDGTMQATGLVRYHMVYFRQDTVMTGDTGVPVEQWNVYYRRSKPLDPQKASDLTQANPWEPAEYRLNNRIHIRFDPNGPWPNGQRSRIYGNASLADTLKHLDTPDSLPRRLDAGFPALTVTREPTDSVAMVRVVFACTDATSVEIQPVSALMIAECSFPDLPSYGTVAPPPVIGDARALVCVMAHAPQQGDPLVRFTIDTMARWGTPVISSALGRTYYAWSAREQPIGVGSKPSTQGWFTADNQIHAVEWLPNPSLRINAMYPTLIPYANIHAGETTSSLAWQEAWNVPGNNNRWSIRYARLKTDTTGAVTHYLPRIQQNTYMTTSDGVIAPQGNTMDIGQWAENGWLPSITRSVQHDTMLLLRKDTTEAYQFETVTWQSTADGAIYGGALSSIIRRRHFLHTNVEQPPTVQPEETLHYWFNQSTYSASYGLMHPTVNIARHHPDDFPLLSADLALSALGGNRSDTATMTTYAALPRQAELGYRADWLINVRDWWTGGTRNAIATVDQLSLLYGPYGIPTNLVHGINNTKTTGMWPHIASRQDPTTVLATYGMRRIQQTGAMHPPSIVFDAASFYKPESIETLPAIYRGVSTVDGEILMRLVDRNGVSIPQHFFEERGDVVVEPTLHAVSNVLSSIYELDLGFELVGTFTDDIDIAIDEVDASNQLIRSVAIDPAALGINNGRVTGRLVLVNGGGSSYRVRLSSDVATIPCELLELTSQDLSFDREPLTTTVLVDLARESRTGRIRCLLYPVPASDALSVITPAGAGQDLVVTIAEPRGSAVRRSSISRNGATIDIRDLAIGIYTVTVTDASGRMLHQQLLPVIR